MRPRVKTIRISARSIPNTEQLHCIDFVHWEGLTGSVVQKALTFLRDQLDFKLSAASRNVFRALFGAWPKKL
ncbi:hypothetical protein CEK60_00300 [Halomonas sp. N3-2A]|nr:hypothetical protein CEK60_00300 [Halomonas sp. N3-2A]